MQSFFYAQKYKTPSQGFAALLTVVIVSAAALTISLGAALLGIGELDLGYTAQKGSSAFAYTEGCLEEALQQLKFDTGYNGGTLSNGDGSCRIQVSGSGTARTIVVEGDIQSSYYKHLEVEVFLEGVEYPTITITDWNEGG